MVSLFKIPPLTPIQFEMWSGEKSLRPPSRTSQSSAALIWATALKLLPPPSQPKGCGCSGITRLHRNKEGVSKGKHHRGRSPSLRIIPLLTNPIHNKPFTPYPPPPRGGGGVGSLQVWVTFPSRGFKKKAKNFSPRLVFCVPQGPKPVSDSRKTSHSPPMGGGYEWHAKDLQIPQPRGS